MPKKLLLEDQTQSSFVFFSARLLITSLPVTVANENANQKKKKKREQKKKKKKKKKKKRKLIPQHTHIYRRETRSQNVPEIYQNLHKIP